MAQDFSHPNAQPFLLEAGKHAILFIHGFTGTPSHMRPIADAVHAAGFSARGILLPGHGETLEAMEKTTGAQWLSACENAFSEMKSQYETVSVAGLSMGGILSLLIAERFSPSCCVLYAPAIDYASPINYLSPIAKHFMKVNKWNPPAPKNGDFLTEYDHGYIGAPLAKVEDMTHLQKMARQDLHKITCPVLVIQSHSDESVHARAPERILRRVNSDVRELSWVDNSSHVCTIGPDRDYVAGRTIDFLDRFGV